MTDILKLAKQAGADPAYFGVDMTEGTKFYNLESIQRFADLIRADEREACALVCEAFKTAPIYIDDDWADMCATAIRARGVKDHV